MWIWIELAIERVMDEPIVHARFMYVARLWIVYLESVIWTMLVRAGREVAVQCENVLHQKSPKLLYISAIPLSFYKFFPRIKKIFD